MVQFVFMLFYFRGLHYCDHIVISFITINGQFSFKSLDLHTYVMLFQILKTIMAG